MEIGGPSRSASSFSFSSLATDRKDRPHCTCLVLFITSVLYDVLVYDDNSIGELLCCTFVAGGKW